MERFLNFCWSHKRKVSEIKRNVDRLLNLLCGEKLEDIILKLQEIDEVIEMLLDKYQLGTAIKIMDTIKMISIYYAFEPSYMNHFLDEYNNLVDLKENKNMYSKFSIFEIKKILDEKAIFYTQNHASFTFLRNFLVLYLTINELPFRLAQWKSIKIVIDDYGILEDFDDYPIYLVVQDFEFYFIVNKLEDGFKGQFIHKVSETSRKLLIKFIINNGLKKEYLICNKSGKSITITNLANSITNISRILFGKSLSINNIRSQIKVFQEQLNLNKYQKIVFNL
tara:strand:+ start:5975 stop:6814 length:840 start_codon:yes stop_codon:yes gene_type:complete